MRDGVTPAAAPASAPAPAPAPAPSSGSYTVQTGDTLASIAAAQGVPGGWQALWEKNRATVGDPNVISVGQQLVL
ncbi:LysM peptidoglycan-binding domain-containing protein [Geodermatophilus sp. YIM 151500]|nr:LysM peptidoglycan-binding domain-containing protein [Geodermatophilus sp. YIM 151500]